MVESRRSRHGLLSAQLKSVTLHLMQAEVQVVRDYQALYRLENLREEGLIIEIVDKSRPLGTKKSNIDLD
jgi:hypothetical protein